MPAKGQKRKQQIIDTAKEMFILNGFQSTHIGQVCEKLNIARGTVYQYFGNKREILYAILEAVEEKIDDIMDPDDLRDFLKSNPVQKAMVKFESERVASCISTILSEPIVIKLIYKDIAGIDEEVITRITKFLEYITKVVSRDVDEIKRKGVYKKNVNPDITALMLIGGVMYVVYDYDRKKMNVLDKEVVEAVVSNYLYGVLK
ncbi:MAG: TetR/AcrR family transcriptional regulator [Spirochaetes bacterium]|nr:MAG: TetR/AcrR family transcriptional regulator [Spirochaetota bacterium]